MLQKPDIDENKLILCVRERYGLNVAQVIFLPLGADPNAVVYRAVTDDATSYFLKLRRGVFDEISVLLPKFLSDQGIGQVIIPHTTSAGELWTHWDAYTLILYPYIEGQNGYRVALTDRQWFDFGAALKAVHTAILPPGLAGRIVREAYSPQWREMARQALSYATTGTFQDPVAIKTADFMNAKRNETLDLLQRTDHLAQVLQTHSPEFVLCHSDAHAGNILIGDDGALYIVDWDNPILAPKERDLMFIGGAQGFIGLTAQEEVTRFYRGYGDTQIDFAALAYYRYERIIDDIAVFCQMLLWTDEGGEDREQSLTYLMSNYLPNNTIEIAYQSDPTLWPSRNWGA